MNTQKAGWQAILPSPNLSGSICLAGWCGVLQTGKTKGLKGFSHCPGPQARAGLCLHWLRNPGCASCAKAVFTHPRVWCSAQKKYPEMEDYFRPYASKNISRHSEILHTVIQDLNEYLHLMKTLILTIKKKNYFAFEKGLLKRKTNTTCKLEYSLPLSLSSLPTCRAHLHQREGPCQPFMRQCPLKEAWGTAYPSGVSRWPRQVPITQCP